MAKKYNTAELTIVRIAARDIIVTSPTMSDTSKDILDFAGSTNSTDYVIGRGED